MKRIILIVSFGVILSVGAGCSMCCGPYDYDYPTFGGKHQRVNPQYGRVGSIFSDPLAGYMGDGADSNLEAAPELEPRRPLDSGDDTDLDLDLPEIESEDGPATTQENNSTQRIGIFGRPLQSRRLRNFGRQR